MDGNSNLEGLKPIKSAVQTAVAEVARERLTRINALFGSADSAAHRVRDMLHNAKRIHGYPAFGSTERRDAQVHGLISEAAELHAELGRLIADLQREVA